jgi:hypothetical protein
VLSRTVYKKRRGRRFLTSIAGMSLVAGLFLGAGTVLAVHDLDFQLDGNTAATCPTPTGLCTTSQKDWNDLFTVASAAGTQTVTSNAPISGASGAFTTATFSRDLRTGTSQTCKTDAALTSSATTFCTYDTTTYATGSKDTLEINTGWACNADMNVNSKIDIMNAYSASYTRTSDGHKILYFGLDKNKDNGTNDAGFWFLQGDATCDASGGGHPSFSGTHRLGDVLVVAEYSRGGGVGNITAYRWDGVTPLVQIANATVGLADCKTKLGNDDLCGTTNSGAQQFNGNITTPWLTSDATLGVGHTVVPPDFFEGAIDITAAFANSGGGTAPTCFNTYIADTRSSTSLTATLFDYARGKLGECSSKTETTPVDATVTTQPPASTIPVDSADAKVLVKDKTVLTVNGIASFSGSLSWHICGPTAAASTQLCDGTTGNVGVDLGSQAVTAAGTYYSPTATVTSAGRYCFRAEFSGDEAAGVPASSDSRSTECFTVAPVQPTLTTDASDGVEFGQPISDSVTLSGTAHKPGSGGPAGSNGTINPTAFGGDATGAITVVAYGPDSCSTVAFTSGSITASGDGVYGGAGSAFEFTPLTPGQYIFVASYAGDSPNTLDIPATACTAAPDSEKVSVQTIPSTISTGPTWVPNDSATVTSSVVGNNLPANGTITFSLYRDTVGKTALENCQAGTATGREYTNGILTGAAAHSVTKASDNTKSYNVDLTLYWLVTYAPGDTAHTGIQSNCQEAIAVDVTADAGPGTAFP